MTQEEALPSSPIEILNYIGGEFVAPSSGEYLDVLNPATDSEVIGRVGLSNAQDVDQAVQAAAFAFPAWSKLTIKVRAAKMLQFHALLKTHAAELAALIVQENGKNYTEALADVAKGNETVEYACSLPQLAAGRTLQVSSGCISCQDSRVPLGVVASIVPFNFPCMVPLWTLPIALVMGNTVVLKPSEKVPLTMHRIVQLSQDIFPPGVLNLVQGTAPAVTALMEHPTVQAVTFVGSSPVAKLVSETCRALHKRCTALGGAKNHLVALTDDCHLEQTAQDVVVSFAGCAGQRCMAASVLLLVGSHATKSQALLDLIVQKASALQPGTAAGQVGPVIDAASYKKIHGYIQAAEADGAQVLLDGRVSWKDHAITSKGGHWVGPTVLLHTSPHDKTVKEEVFGPVLSVYRCQSWQEAITIENANPFGNAAAVYTSNGGHAEWFTSRFRAAMLGVNIGIPVPREPFSFGGLYGTQSKYGDMDMTGDGGMEFFSHRIKVTSKWPMAAPVDPSHAEGDGAAATAATDHAHFSGRM